MKNLWEDLYEKVIYYGEDRLAVGKRLDEEVDKLTEPYKVQLSQSEAEKLRNRIYAACHMAEYEGFRLGVKCQ